MSLQQAKEGYSTQFMWFFHISAGRVNILAPSPPSEKSFAQIVEVMHNHHHPKPSPIVCRYIFNSHSQKEGESLSLYLAELQKLATDCDSGASLQGMLRDRLVYAVKDRRIQKRVAEPGLNFKKGLEMTQAMEAAEKNRWDTFSNEFWTSLCNNRGKEKQPKNAKIVVNKEEDCRLENAECYKCHMRGHILAVCKSRNEDETSGFKGLKMDLSWTELINVMSMLYNEFLCRLG